MLIAEVHIHKSKALRVAIGPLEVIQEAPSMISAHLRTICNSARKLLKVLPEKLNALHVWDTTILIGTVVVAATIFRDFDGNFVTL